MLLANRMRWIIADEKRTKDVIQVCPRIRIVELIKEQNWDQVMSKLLIRTKRSP